MKGANFEGGKVLDGKFMITNAVESRLKSMDGIADLTEAL
ncbi:DNA polymerase III alpha subunit [Salipiger mucosus DSM 16094]|uniref:DNA polymerase III alpha subunit n=1 Tax=Salipiger mucosus DSM 16094 TaxID=1123237 RepID=S9QV52_9RHOB|nr:DNA polymerase III alpha subunit [Salipiger mucosus DSM 16094]